MDRDISNIIAGVVLFAGSAALYLYTGAADYRMGAGVAYDAGLMPKLWLSIAGLCAIVTILKGVAGRIRRPGAGLPLAQIAFGRLAASFGLTALFLAGFSWLGFWIPVLLFIPAFSMAFGYQNVPVILIATLIFATATWLVFAWFLEVQVMPLPEFMMWEN